MKKIIALFMIILVLVMMVACGNKDVFDTVYTYDYAIIAFPDGTSKKVEIKQWTERYIWYIPRIAYLLKKSN